MLSKKHYGVFTSDKGVNYPLLVLTPDAKRPISMGVSKCEAIISFFEEGGELDDIKQWVKTHKKVEEKQVKKAAVAAKAPAAPSKNEELDSLKADMADMKAMFAQMMARGNGAPAKAKR